jgi:hypothetical protein
LLVEAYLINFIRWAIATSAVILLITVISKKVTAFERTEIVFSLSETRHLIFALIKCAHKHSLVIL